MDKKRHERLMVLADVALRDFNLFIDNEQTEIPDSYNGQIAALGVSIATIGVLPTLAIYYQDKPTSNELHKANRRAVLEVIARMITLKDMESTAQGLLEYAINNRDDDKLTQLKKEVIDCSIALKQVVRTYKLVPVCKI